MTEAKELQPVLCGEQILACMPVRERSCGSFKVTRHLGW